jgi:hypothetical protein
MLSRVANLIKAHELEAIRARLEKIDDWAAQQAAQIPAFHLADQGIGNYPAGMGHTDTERFRTKHRPALAFYGIAIQYLERGMSETEIEAVMLEKHNNMLHCRDGVKDALANHDPMKKALLDLIEKN